MISVIYDMIGASVGSCDELVLAICGAFLLILTVVFIDMVYRVFSHFWR